MNKVLLSLLFSAFILTGYSYAQTTPAPVEAPVAPTVVATPKTSHHERHPEIRKAMRKLRGAKEDLEKAAHDYDGHKAKAIAAIDEALSELHEAITATDSK